MQPGPTIQPSPYSNLARAGLHPHGHERPPSELSISKHVSYRTGWQRKIAK